MEGLSVAFVGANFFELQLSLVMISFLFVSVPRLQAPPVISQRPSGVVERTTSVKRVGDQGAKMTQMTRKRTMPSLPSGDKVFGPRQFKTSFSPAYLEDRGLEPENHRMF